MANDVSGMKTVDAHFDGKQIVLAEPAKLTAHTTFRVIVTEVGETFSDNDHARDAEYEPSQGI
jgi:hypothetical protein